MNAAAAAVAQTTPARVTAFTPLPENEVVVLRPSDIVDMDACSFAHGLKRHGVLAEAVSSALIFGTVGHEVVRQYITHLEKANLLPALFEKLWQEARNKHLIRYAAYESYDSLLKIGQKLVEMFPDWWKQAGIRPFKLPNGEYSVEQRLTTQLSPTVILSAQPDLLFETVRTLVNAAGHVYAKPGDLGILDFKFPRSESPLVFAQRSLQPTYYKISAEANKAALGIAQDIRVVGYVEMLKQKSRPRIVPPFLFERPRHLVEDAIRKAFQTADRIRRGEHTRDTKMAFNSPCSLCEFEALCLNGNDEGIVLPPKLKLADLVS